MVAPSLHRTGISAAFRNAGNVDLFACGEGIGGHYVTNVHIGSAIKTELFQVSLCGNARLLVMTRSRLCNQLFSDVLEAELYGIVSIVFRSLFLHYGAGTCLDHRYGDRCTVVREDLGHTQLSSDDSFFHRFFLL